MVLSTHSKAETCLKRTKLFVPKISVLDEFHEMIKAIFLFINISVKQLHKEFFRAGSDVIQAFTFYASDDKMSKIKNDSVKKQGVSFYWLSFYLRF